MTSQVAAGNGEWMVRGLRARETILRIVQPKLLVRRASIPRDMSRRVLGRLMASADVYRMDS